MPSGVNRVTLIGHLGADPEMRYTANGTAMASMRLAVNRNVKSPAGWKEETDWITVVAWNKTAEICSQHLTSGRQIYVEGRLSTRSFDGKDGKKQYRTEVVANEVVFLGGRGESVQPGDDLDGDDLPFE